jgi:hypothetical protein
VPREFLEAMRVLEPGLFGTVTDAPWPWDLPAWLEGVRAGTIGDGVVFGHAGHGVNSWAMHYYLVHGPLALLVQLLWGGAYTDHAAAAARIGLAFEACARLILADGLQRLPPRPRLVVVESDLHGRQVGWLDEHGQGTLGPHPNPLAQALALLEPLRRPQRSAKNASASSSSSSSNS